MSRPRPLLYRAIHVYKFTCLAIFLNLSYAALTSGLTPTILIGIGSALYGATAHIEKPE